MDYGADEVELAEGELLAVLVEEVDGELEAVVTGADEVELAEGELLAVLVEEVDGELEAVVTGADIFLRVARSDL